MADAGNIKKRAPRTKKKQLEIMVNFLHEHKLLLAPKVEPKDLKERDLQWKNLVQLLNECPQGPQKSLVEWKHVLKELKTNTKRKAREIFVEKTATGGGPPGNKLTDVEERLIGLLSKVSIEGAPIPEGGLDAGASIIEQHEDNSETQESNFQNDFVVLPIEDIRQPNVELSLLNTETLVGSEINIMESSNITKNNKRPQTRRYKAKSNSADNPNTRKLLEKQISETHNLSVSIDKLSQSIFALSNAIEKLAQRE